MKQIPNDLFFTCVESEIKVGRSVRFKLRGDSMLPLLRSGKDDIVLYPCQREDLKPMDLVLFRYKGNHLLHRIIKVEGDHFFIQGDGSIVAKEECLYADVVGKVREVIRPSGRVVFLNSRKWRLLSFLWIKSGIFRTLLLKVMFRLKRI